MADICVTVPTVRNPGAVEAYVENANRHGFDTDRLHFLLVTEDFLELDEMAAMLDHLDVSGDVIGGAAREAWFAERGLSADADIIPKRSHAETSFGLLWMLDREGFEYGIFIDDDTAPHREVDFFGTHLAHLEGPHSVERVSSDEQWVNVLYQNVDDHGLYPRGYPYSAMDEQRAVERAPSGEIVANQGLWTNVPDLDAVRILMDGDLRGQATTRTTADDITGNFVVAPGNYLTISSMNLSFKREVIPAFYQFPMDDNQWDIGRFDDIWSGLTLKKAADMLDKQVMNGYPLCEHNKAERSTFSDLTNEVPGLELNEHLWKAIDRAPAEAEDYYEAYKTIIGSIDAYDFSEYQNAGFIDRVVDSMQDWLRICKVVDPKEN